MARVLVWMVVGAMGLAVAPEAFANEPSRVVYEGQLLDGAKRPLSGVFPMKFNLYRSEKSTREAWSEEHFVAVLDGRYAIELGAQRPIPNTLKLDRVYLGVAVGGQELVRELLRTEPRAAAAPSAPAATAPSAPLTKGDVIVTAPRQRGADESYAEIAGFAYEAERAKSADSIGGLTAKDIQALVRDAKPAPVSIGTKSRESGVAGGTGGQPFTLKCPKGHVMTGIMGTAAALVDSVGIICSPLE